MDSKQINDLKNAEIFIICSSTLNDIEIYILLKILGNNITYS